MRSELLQRVSELLPSLPDEELSRIIEKAEGKTDKEKRLQKAKDTFLAECGKFVGEYPQDMVRSFFDYWTEPNRSKTKMRFEMEKTWELSLRLAKWSKNSKKFGSQTTSRAEQLYKAFK